jgi:kynureninase
LTHALPGVTFENSSGFARRLDAEDPLRDFRNRFHIPVVDGREAIYFCGNSLGLQPKTAREAVEREMRQWEELAVEGHFAGRQPWFTYHKQFKEPLGQLVGAQPHETVVMNNLTTNLHLMLTSFYRPTPGRYKVLMEGNAFPSDQYAVESQVSLHGFSPETAIVEVQPRPGEYTLRTEDIIDQIEAHGNELALVLFGGINYYTGQVYDLEAIARAGHRAGARVGFDLAHAIGNVPLRLHEWDADFAVWCSYKYLNSGPGGIAGAFVHEKHANSNLPRLAGWWGYHEESRFRMEKGFKPTYGADGWQLANGPVLLLAAHRAALDVFAEAGMDALRRKSRLLSGYLEFILRTDPVLNRHVQILTPADPQWRGCQLSLRLPEIGKGVFERLGPAGVIADWREPDVIRLAPVPLYNSFEEVYRCGQILHELIGADRRPEEGRPDHTETGGKEKGKPEAGSGREL